MSIKGGHVSYSIKGTNTRKLVATIMNRVTDSVAHRVKTAATKAMLQLGQKSIIDWYAASGLTTGQEVASALRVESSFLRNQGGAKLIKVTSYFDVPSLNAMSGYFKSAEKWCYRHSEINCDYTPGTYIFLLRWNTGALNLPEESNVSDWINDNYQVSPYGALQSYFAISIMANIESTTNALIRKRNRSMGAGTESKNNSGINNLRHGK